MIRSTLGWLSLACINLFLVPGWAQPESKAADHIYPVTFGVEFKADESATAAYLDVSQENGLLLEVRLRAPAKRYSKFAGPGEVFRQGDRVIWRPPAQGGRLSYVVDVNQRRGSGGYDAYVDEHYALVRGDDLFPPAAIRQASGATSDSRLVAQLPKGWRLITPYEADSQDGWRVTNPRRKFDRPTGWLVAGRLGVRRDIIGELPVSIAGPTGNGIQRIPMLALLRWTLPDVLALAARPLPKQLSVVSAGDPMWRGGLSGPGSLYIHAERPLLSENGTSTLLHEAIHVLLPIASAKDHDWIDEGIAEYLTLYILRDTGSISRERFDSAIQRFSRRGKAAGSLRGGSSRGARTAKAVGIFHKLDQELRKATDGKLGLPALVTRLSEDRGPIDLAALEGIAREIAPGAKLKSLSQARQQ